MQVKQFTENMVDFCRSYRVGPEAIRDILEQAPEISTWTGHNPPYGHIAPHVGGLGFNCQQAPFDDPRLRWAIAYALDQKSILEEVYGRDVEVAESPFPGYPVFQKLLSEIDDLVREYNFIDYDPAKSTQWMQEAGYQKNAAGLWAGQNGARIGLTLYADGTNTWYYVESYAKMASKIVEELRQAGFDCQLKLFEESPQEAAEQGGIEIEDTYTIAAKGHAPLFILDSLGMGINDPVDLFMDYQPEHILPVGGYSSNLTRWVDDSFTKATDELLKLSPQDPRALASFRKCMEIWYQNLSFIPLFQTYHRVPYNTRYWTNWPSAENPYAELAFSSHGALLLVINLKAQT
jgi:peptide/nickel transport system substrate-binding protein